MVVPIIIPNGLASEWERVGSLPAGDAVDVDDPAGLPETLTGEATKAASNAQAENNCMVMTYAKETFKVSYAFDAS